MDSLIVIADDLTGANDTGIQFSQKGMVTEIVLDSETIAEITDLTDVLVVDTDTRAAPSEDAIRTIKNLTKRLKKMGVNKIYKKLDSTLRGNVGAEIDAILDTYDYKFTIVAPAFPKMGRTTIDGIHYLNGIALSETELAKDPKCPVLYSDVKKLFSLGSNKPCGNIFLETIRKGKEEILKQINEQIKKGTRVFIFDAEMDSDLETIASLYDNGNENILCCGCAGLAEYLFKTPPAMLVAGSVSSVTRQQLLAFNRMPNVKAVEIDTVKALESDEEKQNIILKALDRIGSFLQAGFDVALHLNLCADRIKLTDHVGREKGMESNQVSFFISDLISEIAVKALEKNSLSGFILTGGDIARTVCNRLDVKGIKLIKSVETGIPLGITKGTYKIKIITKAGAFGNENSLINALNVMKGGE